MHLISPIPFASFLALTLMEHKATHTERLSLWCCLWLLNLSVACKYEYMYQLQISEVALRLQHMGIQNSNDPCSLVDSPSTVHLQHIELQVDARS